MNKKTDRLLIEQVADIAREAAGIGGSILAEGYNLPKSISFKGDIDLVTQFDLASEKAVVEKIRGVFPDHVILAEEGGEIQGDTLYKWYIDPLDGTTNFAHGFPFFCVSIAFEAPGPSGPEIKVGVVFDPLRREMFFAQRGAGAFLNDAPISVSREGELQKALLATGFPYYIQQTPDPVLTRFRKMCLRARGVRRAGSAALDLASVAAGRLDGFWEEGLSPWDTAAGILLVEEAGGRVTDFKDGAFRPQLKELLATNGRLAL